MMSEDGLKLKYFPVLGHPETLEVRIQGRIDAESAPDFYQGILNKVGEGYRLFVFDCRHFGYSSSRGLEALLAIYKIVNIKEGKLILYGVSSRVMKLINLVEFERFFGIFGNREQAFKSLGIIVMKE